MTEEERRKRKDEGSNPNIIEDYKYNGKGLASDENVTFLPCFPCTMGSRAKVESPVDWARGAPVPIGGGTGHQGVSRGGLAHLPSQGCGSEKIEAGKCILSVRGRR